MEEHIHQATPTTQNPIDLIIEDTHYYSNRINTELSFEAIISEEGIRL